MENEPKGWTDGDRALASGSPFHDEHDGVRKELTVTLNVTVSIPQNYEGAQLAEQLAWVLLSDPYVRDVKSPDYDLFQPLV